MNFMTKLNSKYKIFVLLLIISVLAVSFLELWKTQPQTAWQADSEALVWGRVSDAQRHGFFTHGGLLRDCSGEDSEQAWVLYAENSMPDKINFVYYRQSGLQGSIDALLAMALQTGGVSNETIRNMIWRLNSTALVFVMLLICWWMFEEIGWAAALGGASCLLLSSWMTMTMANAYWVVWTMFLPFAVAAFMGKRQATTGRISLGWYVAIFVSSLARFLCGFEFVSAIMLSVEVPIFFYFIKSQDIKARIVWIKIGLWVGILELAAFLFALGITITQIMVLQQQDFLSAAACILDAVKYRTGMFVTEGNMQQYSEAISNSLNVSRLSVVKTYLTSSEPLWNGWSVRQMLFFWMLSAVGENMLGKSSITNILCQGGLLLFSILPAVSWYFLGSGHSAIHTVVNYVLLLIPFVPICIGLLFQNVVGIVQHLAISK